MTHKTESLEKLESHYLSIEVYSLSIIRFTCVTAVRLAMEKMGGLSLMSDISMLTITVDDMGGSPLSKALTAKE